ncbi:MAG: ABC transporter ATP-binding protein [Pseudonocardiaceae bacterium]
MRSPWELVGWLIRPTPVGPDELGQPAPALRVREVFTRFWPDARPFRAWLALSLVLVMVGPILDTVTIWLFKLLIDNVLTVRNFSAFPPIAIVYVAITVVIGAVEFADDYLTAWIGESFLHRLRTRVFTHLQTLSVSFFDRRPLGDTLSRLTGDVTAIENLVLSGVTGTAAQVVKIVLFTGVLFYLSWPLALASVVTVPVFWLATRFFSHRIKAASREVRRRSGEISTLAEESLGNTTLIQVYGRQQTEITRFTQASRRSVTAELAATRLSAALSPLSDLCEVAGVMAIIGLGVWELTSNRITLGGLLVFLVYLSQLTSPLRGLGQLSTTAYAAAASAERIIDLLDQEPNIHAHAHASAQASGLHQAPDPFGGDPDTAHDEFGPDPAHAGVAVQVAVDLTDRLGELGVGALALARPVGAPPVVALAGHSELVAHERDRELLGVGPVRDRRVFHGCSFANQAATFFAKSRSILKTALSLRSRSSSARSVSDRSLSGTRPPSFAFFTHLPNVISWTPILLATSVIDRPESRCRLTACSLYSWVKLRRVATRFPPLAISGSHNGCLQDRVRSNPSRQAGR